MNDKIDIFSIPLYYISANENKKLNTYLVDKGFKDINLSKPVIDINFNEIQFAKLSVISPSCYNSVKMISYGDYEFTSKGDVVSSINHIEIWKKCINRKLPYVIVCEGELIFNEDIDENIIEKMNIALKQENGMFVSPNQDIKIYDTNDTNYRNVKFSSTNFYILSRNCCKKLLEKAFPINIKIGKYIAFMHNISEINLNGNRITYQESDIQQIDKPSNKNIPIYLSLGLSLGLSAVLSIIIFILLFYFKRNCNIKNGME